MQTLHRDGAILDEARAHTADLLSRLFPASASAFAAGPAANSGRAAGATVGAIPKGHNVVGVGFGAKSTMGVSRPNELAVRVYVRRKLPVSALTVTDRIPQELNGTPTDVIAVGDIGALWPCSCGDSIGHKNITAGTLGCVVSKRGGGSARYVLSNNHVLANSNACSVNDEVLQPGPADGGTLPRDHLASLTAWQPIDFSGAPNDIDAAIAEIVGPASNVNPTINSVGKIALPTVGATLYQSVRKSGRTTGHTVGVIMDIAATIKVSYGVRVAVFRDQIAVVGVGPNPFSLGGDSGSLVVDAVGRQPVGLLFAGGGAVTFANPIDDVLNTLAIDIVV